MLNDVWGDPTIYKGIKIYPITMQNAELFYDCVTCLTINKKEIPDINIVRMSYLDFIIQLSQEEKYNYFYNNLILLLELVFKNQMFQIVFNQEKKKYNIEILVSDIDNQNYKQLLTQFEQKIAILQEEALDYEAQLKLKSELEELNNNMQKILQNITVVDGNDFNTIRQIIFNQNLIKIDEEVGELQQVLKEAKEKYDKINQNKNKGATIEELIISYVIGISNGTPQDYKNAKYLTLYQFHKGLERMNLIKQQDMLSSALAMGSIQSKDMVYWLDHIKEKGIYDDIICTEEETEHLKGLK